MAMARRLLVALPQSLFDRASGAAVSMRHAACLLAAQGWDVQLLCTSATESGRPGLPLDDEDLGGARLQLLRLPDGAGRDWAQHDGGRFEAAALAALQQQRPELLLSFGADAPEQRLCAAARAQGTRVVLALHNLAYRDLPLPPHDALLLPSHFMRRAYAAAGVAGRAGRPVLVLPPPLWDADVIAATRQPVFATFVNPEPEKGADLVVRLAAACPQWPFLVVGGRAGATRLAAAARAAGLDASALDQVRLVAGGGRLREVLALTRVVLMPSRVDEAAGRVAAEAVANGLPALVSDRGGLPEMVEGLGAAAVVPWAETLPASVERWARALRALADEAVWQAAAERAAAVAPRWRSAAQGPALAAALQALL